ncbi:MAG: alpha/beta hydrolase [Candidatus Hodarchaeota archaeon]
MSRKSLSLLIVGFIIFTSGFFPLAIVNIEIPTQSFKTFSSDAIPIVFDVIMKSGTSTEAPVAILIHGFSGNRKMMKLIGLSLAEKGFVSVSLDLRGHGDSGGFMGGSTNFNADVEGVIQFLEDRNMGNTSEMILIGHSMGGGVAINLSLESYSPVATVGIAPSTSPEAVNTTTPRNLLLVVSTGDTIIQNDLVLETFYRSINGTGEPNTIYNINGTMRMLFVDESSDHFTIVYDREVIGEIVKWATMVVLGEEQTLSLNPDLIGAAVLISLIGGTIVIISFLSIVYDKIRNKKEINENRSGENLQESNWKDLLKTGIQAFLAAGIGGSAIGLVISFAVSLISPLFFTNFIASLFLGNSIALGIFAWRKLKGSKKQFSYTRFIKESLRTESTRVDIGFGIITAIMFVVLFYTTMGANTTSTLSTSFLRVVYLPLYLTIYILTFLFYESFFKAVVRPMIGNGSKRMIGSAIYQLVLVVSSLLLLMVLLLAVLQQNVAFFLLGINLIVLLLGVLIISGELFYEKTGGWIAQIIVSAVLFSTSAVVFSPIIYLF